MKIVILGAGIVGIQMARRLSEDDDDVVLIDKNPETARISANILDCIVLNEDGTMLDTLKKAGIATAEYFLAVTGSDEVNMVACSMVAGESPQTKRIARVRNPYFSSLDPAKRAFMGIDFIVNPDIEAARAILDTIDQGAGKDVVHLHEHNLQLRAFHVHADDLRFAGQTVKSVKARLRRDFLITSILREKTVLVPSGDTVIEGSDLLYFLARPEELDAMFGAAGDFGREFRKVIIVGGGRIGRFLAEDIGRKDGGGLVGRLLGALSGGGSRNIVFVDQSIDRCKQLTQLFPKALVLNRDICDENAFQEEGLAGADLLLAVTDNQELNLLTAMNAKINGVEKAVALVVNNTYLQLEERIAIDGILSMKSSIASSIINLIRGGNLKTVYSMYGAGVKILEFTVVETSWVSGRRLQDISMPRGSLVIFMVRSGKSVIPSGDTLLAPGDHLGIFAKVDVLAEVEELFLDAR